VVRRVVHCGPDTGVIATDGWDALLALDADRLSGPGLKGPLDIHRYSARNVRKG
jgi:hypothetical protein